MANAKPYTTREKRLFDALSRAMIASDIQAKVVKPEYEKSTGKPYPTKETYLDMFLEKDPEAKRALKCLQRNIKRQFKQYADELDREKANG